MSSLFDVGISFSTSTHKLKEPTVSGDKPYNSRKSSTFGYEVSDVEALDRTSLLEIGQVMNRYSVSSCSYTKGHRAVKNIENHLGVLLLDIDEPDVYELVDDSLLDNDVAYVKVPSASNLNADYKFHYMLFLDGALDVSNKTIYQNQVIEILNQLGLNYQAVDVSALKDMARHFSPACINPEFEDYDDLIEVRTGSRIQVPTVTEDKYVADKASNKPKQTKMVIDSNGIFATGITKDRNIHLAKSVGVWLSNGIQYEIVLDVSLEWNSCLEEPLDESEVIATVKSIYQTAKDNEDKFEASKYIFECDSDVDDVTASFTKRWEQMDLVSNDNLVINWKQNFKAFNEVIYRNQNNLESIKIVSPASTGTGKSQNIIHKAISLHGSKVGTLIVVMRTDDADIMAHQVQEQTDNKYVGVFHSKEEASYPVNHTRILKEALEIQCLFITHEMFKQAIDSVNTKDELLNGRDLIIIDEEISAITNDSIDIRDIEIMTQLLKKENKKHKSKQLTMELGGLNAIHTALVKVVKSKNYTQFTPLSVEGIASVASEKSNAKFLESLQLTKSMEVLSSSKLSPSSMGLGISNKAIDEMLFKKYISICGRFNKFFNQWTYIHDNGGKEIEEDETVVNSRNVSINTASEILPSRSVLIMDATASVNEAYKLYQKYQKNLVVLDKIICRNYQNVTLHTAKTTTGKESILSNAEEFAQILVNEIQAKSSDKKGDKVLVIVHKGLEPHIEALIPPEQKNRIFVDHWGNITGTNSYRLCNKIFIFGLNHKPDVMIRNIHTLAKSANLSFSSNDNDNELRALKRTNLSSEILQAANRGAPRMVTDSKGNCPKTDIYLTLPYSALDATAIEQNIISEMNDIETTTWEFRDEAKIKFLKSHTSTETVIKYLLNNTNENDISISTILLRDELRFETKPFTSLLGKRSFIEALEIAGFTIESRLPTEVDRRGRVKKRKEKFFTKI